MKRNQPAQLADAPEGMKWKCPTQGCAWATTVGSIAAAHRNSEKHGEPTLIPDVGGDRAAKPKAPWLDQHCGGCHFCTPAGYCKRFPPQAATGSGYLSDLKWPRVDVRKGMSWCGEWRERLWE